MAQLYAKKRSDGAPKAIECTDNGDVYFEGTIAVDDIADVKTATENTADRLGDKANPEAGTVNKQLANIFAKLPSQIDNKIPVQAYAVETDKTLTHTLIDCGAASNTIKTPEAGKSLRIVRLKITASAPTTATLKFGSTVFDKIYIGANGGVIEDNLLPTPHKGAADGAFVIELSPAVSIAGYVKTYEE